MDIRKEYYKKSDEYIRELEEYLIINSKKETTKEELENQDKKLKKLKEEWEELNEKFREIQKRDREETEREFEEIQEKEKKLNQEPVGEVEKIINKNLNLSTIEQIKRIKNKWEKNLKDKVEMPENIYNSVYPNQNFTEDEIKYIIKSLKLRINYIKTLKREEG